MKDEERVKDLSQEEIDELRREAMAKLGKLSTVTSATMLTLLLSNKATAFSAPPPPPS